MTSAGIPTFSLLSSALRTSYLLHVDPKRFCKKLSFPLTEVAVLLGAFIRGGLWTDGMIALFDLLLMPFANTTRYVSETRIEAGWINTLS